jgi:hypothetical protein
VIGSGSAEPARPVPRVRLVLAEHHWDGWGGIPRRDTSVIDVAVGDHFGTTCFFGKKPLVLVGVLPGGEALVRYDEGLSYQRSDSLQGGPVGPETLVVRSTWAHLSTHATDVGCDFSIRILTPRRTDSQPSGLWNDRYSDEFPALGDRVILDLPPEVVLRTQPECAGRLASRHMRLVALMWVLVSKEGTVLATRSFDSDSLVIARAEDCVRQWTYRPGSYQGKPVASWLNVTVEVCPGPPRVHR